MMGRSALVVLAILIAPAARAEELPAAKPKPAEHLQGFLSHGDSGDVLEDFFGSRVERAPEQSVSGSRKYDPVIRWDDRPIRR